MAKLFGGILMVFITIEGIEGTGKSTQASLLKSYLETSGKLATLAVREPGGTLIGEKLREVLLNTQQEPIDPWAELFMYEACRAQLVKNVIRPALALKKVVLCDRFIDSTVAYQGYGRGLDIKAIDILNNFATGGLAPDLTLLIDITPEKGLKRALKRISAKSMNKKEDRFEKEAISFHQRVRQGFLEIADKNPARVKVIDGSGEIPLIHAQICDIIKKWGRLKTL
jgi:dTMP kinase